MMARRLKPKAERTSPSPDSITERSKVMFCNCSFSVPSLTKSRRSFFHGAPLSDALISPKSFLLSLFLAQMGPSWRSLRSCDLSDSIPRPLQSLFRRQSFSYAIPARQNDAFSSNLTPTQPASAVDPILTNRVPTPPHQPTMSYPLQSDPNTGRVSCRLAWCGSR